MRNLFIIITSMRGERMKKIFTIVVVIGILIGFTVSCTVEPEPECTECPKSTCTMITIFNKTSFDLDLVSWSVVSFGDDLVWDVVLNDWVEGISSMSSSTRNVNSGMYPLYFYFALGGPQYRTEPLYTMDNSTLMYTLTDSTIIYEVLLKGVTVDRQKYYQPDVWKNDGSGDMDKGFIIKDVEQTF